MRRRLFRGGLPARVLGWVLGVRAALARLGGGVRVDRAAQEEALREVLAGAAARRRAGERPGARRDGPDRLRGDPGSGPATRPGSSARAAGEPRLAEVGRRIGRAGGLLAVIEAARRDELTGVPGFARRREARGGLEIGR
jgi:hypothetical protein